jgi:hypothetical protein
MNQKVELPWVKHGTGQEIKSRKYSVYEDYQRIQYLRVAKKISGTQKAGTLTDLRSKTGLRIIARGFDTRGTRLKSTMRSNMVEAKME